MNTVTIKLTTAWMTAAGLRRPVEGPILVSEDEALKILDAGAGELVEGEAAPKAKGKGKPAPAPAPDPAPEPAAEPETPVQPD